MSNFTHEKRTNQTQSRSLTASRKKFGFILDSISTLKGHTRVLFSAPHLSSTKTTANDRERIKIFTFCKVRYLFCWSRSDVGGSVKRAQSTIRLLFTSTSKVASQCFGCTWRSRSTIKFLIGFPREQVRTFFFAAFHIKIIIIAIVFSQNHGISVLFLPPTSATAAVYFNTRPFVG